MTTQLLPDTEALQAALRHYCNLAIGSLPDPVLSNALENLECEIDRITTVETLSQLANESTDEVFKKTCESATRANARGLGPLFTGTYAAVMVNGRGQVLGVSTQTAGSNSSELLRMATKNAIRSLTLRRLGFTEGLTSSSLRKLRQLLPEGSEPLMGDFTVPGREFGDKATFVGVSGAELQPETLKRLRIVTGKPGPFVGAGNRQFAKAVVQGLVFEAIRFGPVNEAQRAETLILNPTPDCIAPD